MKDSAMPWVKIYNEIIDDPKIGMLPVAVKWRFIEMIVLAGECDAEGALIKGDQAMTVNEIAWRVRADPAQIAQDLQALASAELLAQNDDVWVVVKFAERQGRSQSERRAQWREWQRKSRAAKLTNTQKSDNKPDSPPDNAGNGTDVMPDSALTNAGVMPLEERREEERRGEGEKSDASATPPTASPESPLQDPISEEQIPQDPTPTSEKKAHKKTRDVLLDHPAVVLYRELCHLTPNEVQRQLIADQVVDQTKWKTAINDWLAHGWNKANVPGMLDKYTSLGSPGANGWGRKQQLNEPAGFAAIREAMNDPKYKE